MHEGDAPLSGIDLHFVRRLRREKPYRMFQLNVRACRGTEFHPRACDVIRLNRFIGMKVLRQFALIVAILLPLVLPTMVCALPNANLSPAERACCRQMRGHCGSCAMTACHGCCQKEPPIASNWNAAIPPSSANAPMNVSAIAASHLAVLLPLAITLSNSAQWQAHSLPQSPPPAISILRI